MTTDTVQITLSTHNATLLMRVLAEALRQPMPADPATGSDSFDANFARAIEIVSEVFGVSVVGLRGPIKTMDFVEARFALYMLLRDHPRASFTRISKAMGRTHGAALYGIQRAQALCDVDKDFARNVSKCRELIGAGRKQ